MGRAAEDLSKSLNLDQESQRRLLSVDGDTLLAYHDFLDRNSSGDSLAKKLIDMGMEKSDAKPNRLDTIYELSARLGDRPEFFDKLLKLRSADINLESLNSTISQMHSWFSAGVHSPSAWSAFFENPTRFQENLSTVHSWDNLLSLYGLAEHVGSRRKLVGPTATCW